MRKDHQTGNDPDHWSDREKLDLGSPLKRDVVRGSSGPPSTLPGAAVASSHDPGRSSPRRPRGSGRKFGSVRRSSICQMRPDRIAEGSGNGLPLFQVTTVTTSRTVVSRFRFPRGRRPFGISEPA